MAAELITHPLEEEYWLRLSQSATFTDGDNGGVAATSLIGTKYLQVMSAQVGLKLSIVVDNPNMPSGGRTLITPEFGHGLAAPSFYFDAATQTSVNTHLIIYDRKIYARDDRIWYVTGSEIEWYVNGSLEWARGSGFQLEMNPLFTPFVPDSIPLFGVSPIMEAAPGGGVTYGESAQAVPPAFLSQVTMTAQGGRRVKIDGSFVDYDTLLSVQAPPTVSGTAPQTPSITCTNTNDPEIGCRLIRQSTGSMLVQENGVGAIMFPPNVEKDLVRLSDDHREMILRRTIPRCYVTSSAVYDFSPPVNPDPIESQVITNDITPRRAAVLDSVDNDVSFVEDGFSIPSYCKYSLSARRWEGTATTSFGYNLSSANSIEYDPPLSLAVFQPVDNDARWMDNLCCPHWLAYDFFPPDTTEDGQLQWPVDGGPIPSAYWLQRRSQWNYQGALPFAKKSKKLNDILSQGLADSEYVHVWEDFYTFKTSPWGVCRPKIIDFDPEPFRAATEDGWTLTDCTATFGASIVLNPSDTTIVAEWDLLKFDAEPYCYPAITDRVELDWTDTNIVSISWYYVNAYGEKSLISSEKGTHAWRNYTDSYYIGDYKQDFSAGHGVTDEGSDSQANGRSALAMANEEQVFAYGLLNGRTAAKIRVEIEVADDTVDVTIEYPIFHLPEDEPTLINENGYHQLLIWPDGPCVRFGNWQWYQPGGFQNPPLISQIGVPPWGKKSTGIDLLAFWKCVFKGTDPADIQADIDSRWDTVEGRLFSDVDDTTIAFLTGGYEGWIVKNFNVPPVCELPELIDGEWRQRNYSLSFEKRRIVSPHVGVDLYVDGVKWTNADADLSIPGYVINDYTRGVENDEDGELYLDTLKLAELRPFRTHLIVTGALRGGNGTSIHSTATPMGLIHTAIATDEGVDIEVWHRLEELGLFEGPRDEDVTWVNIAYHPAGRLVLLFVADGEAFRTESWSWSSDWSTPSSLGMADIACIAINEKTGVEFYALHDGTDTWECYRQDPDESPVYVADIATTTTIAGAGLCISPGALNELVFTYIDGTTRIRTYSTDFGETWH